MILEKWKNAQAYVIGKYHISNNLPCQDRTYYFEENGDTKHFVSSKDVCRKENIVYEDGKFGRLNLIAWLSKDKQYEAMSLYKQEEQSAIEIFKMY